MYEYKNPWHIFGKLEYGPAIYKNDGPVTRYGGYEIHHRQDQVWDVVKDGVCCTQRAGMNGAKSWIDDQNNPTMGRVEEW